MGQGDISPPACVSIALITRSLVDFFPIKPEETIFIGSTSPVGVQQRILGGLSALRDEIEERGTSLILVNTDGWVLGDEAAEYKVRILSSILPKVVVGIQLGDELEPILSTGV